MKASVIKFYICKTLLIAGLFLIANLNVTQTRAQDGEKLELGTVLNTTNTQGESFQVKIIDVELDPEDPTEETYLYTVDYQDATDGKWQNLCNPNAQGMGQAIALSGQWDDTGNYIDNDEITFACTSGVLAKCVRMGYRPWQSVQGYSLRDFHQACTRMLRADYCGNGISHTEDGTIIDIYDRLEIQRPTADSGMVFEAAWSPDGAVWINRTRWPEAKRQIQQECPEKLHNRIATDNYSMTPTEIQGQFPDALIFNDSFIR